MDYSVMLYVLRHVPLPLPLPMSSFIPTVTFEKNQTNQEAQSPRYELPLTIKNRQVSTVNQNRQFCEIFRGFNRLRILGETTVPSRSFFGWSKAFPAI